jgi:ketosteroid isomerase-like protein
LSIDSIKAHAEGLNAFDLLVLALEGRKPDLVAALCIAEITARTSQLGKLGGCKAVADLFGPFEAGETFTLDASNVFLAGSFREARVSAYLAGDIQGAGRLSFGAVMLVDMRRNAIEDAWRIVEIKVQITWVEGASALRPGWAFPNHNRIWQIGDPLPLIVSELDAPWRVYPQSVLQGDERSVVADTYARYSWAIDQADFDLLSGCYTPDAAGSFQPMGGLKGRHAIIGVLKDFRRAWPMMQHHGAVLETLVDGDVAAIIVGRIIPQAREPSGTFGAYYPMRLRRDGAGWRIAWTEYRPGWFTRDSLDLQTLAAATLSGQSDRFD